MSASSSGARSTGGAPRTSTKDAIAVFTAATILVFVVYGGLSLHYDVIRISPVVADVVTYEDIFRRLPDVGRRLMAFALLVAGLYAVLGLMTSAVRLTVVASATVASVVGLAARDEIGLGDTPTALLQGSLVVLSAAWAAVAALDERPMGVPVADVPAVRAAAFLLTSFAFMWLGLHFFYEPLAERHDRSDRLCTETCVETRVLRIYGDWTIHTPAAGEVVMTPSDAVTEIRLVTDDGDEVPR